MIKVGLSGNRYSGKNEIAKIFQKLQIPVFDADTVLKFIINYDGNVDEKIRKKLPHIYGDTFYIKPELVLTRQDFDYIIDCAQYELMNAFVRFYTREDNKKSIYTIFKSSILFERGWHKLMDKNIVVYCPKLHRMERCQEITNKNMYEITSLFSSEIDELKKNKLSDYIIHNYEGCSVTTLKAQINKVDNMLVNSFVE